MRVRVCCGLLCMSLLIFYKIPAKSDDPRTALGLQKQSCEMWTRVRQVHGADAAAMEFWALGVVSGSNWSTKIEDKDYLKGLDPDAVHAWLDTYCAQHPLARFLDAVWSFMTERKKN